MSKNNEKKIKYCVYCGTNIEENKIYCPNCGKLIIKLKSSKEIAQSRIPKESIPLKKAEISRKCPSCGSIITSTILDQCPICNTILEKVSDIERASIQRKPGLIFTDKKLEPEQKYIMKKDTWNLREGYNVFFTCIYILVIVYFLIYILISFKVGTIDIEMGIEIILLSQIPELLFGLYPIWYIYSKNHSLSKLGFFSGSKKNMISILIGILGGLILLSISFLFDYIIRIINDAGLDFFNILASIEQQNLIIKNADLIWVIWLTFLLCLGSFTSEIVFRGVLHNTLKQKFKNEYTAILLVALAYSVVMLFFSFPISLSFFLLNFLAFTVLGILYSINGNIFNTILANIFYNILIIILLSL